MEAHRNKTRIASSVINSHTCEDFIGVPAAYIDDIPSRIPDDSRTDSDWQSTEYGEVDTPILIRPSLLEETDRERAIDLHWRAHHDPASVPVAETRDLLYSSCQTAKSEALHTLKRQVGYHSTQERQALEELFTVVSGSPSSLTIPGVLQVLDRRAALWIDDWHAEILASILACTTDERYQKIITEVLVRWIRNGKQLHYPSKRTELEPLRREWGNVLENVIFDLIEVAQILEEYIIPQFDVSDPSFREVQFLRTVAFLLVSTGSPEKNVSHAVEIYKRTIKWDGGRQVLEFLKFMCEQAGEKYAASAYLKLRRSLWSASERGWKLNQYYMLGEQFEAVGEHEAAAAVYEDAVEYTEFHTIDDKPAHRGVSKAHERCAQQLLELGEIKQFFEMVKRGREHRRWGGVGRRDPEALGVVSRLLVTIEDGQKLEEGIHHTVNWFRLDCMSVPAEFVELVKKAGEQSICNDGGRTYPFYLEMIAEFCGAEQAANTYNMVRSKLLPPAERGWNLDTYYKFGELFSEAGEHEAAAAVYEDAASYVGNSNRATDKPHKLCAAQLIELGEYQKALKILGRGKHHRKHTSIPPGAPVMDMGKRPIYNIFAEILRKKCSIKQYKNAIVAIERCRWDLVREGHIMPDPDNKHMLYMEYIDYAVQQGKYNQAIETIGKAVDNKMWEDIYPSLEWDGQCPIETCDVAVSGEELPEHLREVHDSDT